MNKTQIEWALNPDETPGYTWNPITGCLNGCDFCYARRLANGRLRQRYLANENTIMRFSDGYAPVKLKVTDPFYPRFWKDRVDKMSMYTGVGKGIFICDMSDLFGIGIPEQWINQVFQVIKFNPRNHFYLLTKQPQNLIKFSPFPDNCWVGVTATNSDMFDTAFRALMRVTAKVKYISFEPLLDWTRTEGLVNPLKHLDWVIIGAQTKPTVYPKIEWVQEIAEACDKAGIPVFLKDNLKPLLEKENPSECYNGVFGRWMTDGNGGMVYRLRLRQELPQ